MTADAKPAGPSAFISPVTRPVPLRQSVYEALVELVVGGRLRPGEHLVETELARLLGVSRQPVREALHRLEAEGWVDLRPNQGAFVHVPTDHEVDELLDVRELLEVQTARLAARSASAADRGPAAGPVARGRGCRGRRRHRGHGGGQQPVPRRAGPAGGNAVLADLAGIVSRRVRWYYRQVAPLRGRESWAEHAELIDAVAAGDEDQAAEVARKHTRAPGPLTTSRRPGSGPPAG